MMKVFIEQPCEPNKKNIFDKETGKLKETINFHLTYPYPYGYVLDTISDDGDNLDCYVITNKKLTTGEVVECEPIGILQQFEAGGEDHNILALVVGEQREADETVKQNILEFHKHFYDDRPEKNEGCRTGEFLGKVEADSLLEKSRQVLS